MSRLRPLLLLAALVLGSCTGGSPSDDPDTVAREKFVATYVDLRVTALQGDGALTDEQRRVVLERHAVSEDDLVRFVDVHGADLAFMRSVWDDVEARLDAARPQIDSVG